MFKKCIASLIFVLLLLSAVRGFCAQKQKKAQEEPQQQIDDFSISGFGEKGKKSWDLAGKSADMSTDIIKLNNIAGNLYGENEDVKLTADKGDFNKSEGKVHLEENVVITTSQGTKLTTNSLDWDRKRQIVATTDLVNIERENMVTTACGAQGYPDLSQISLIKDVQVEIKPAQQGKGGSSPVKDKIIITCDGPLQIDYGKNIATFNNNVKVDTKDIVIYSDVMNVYFVPSEKGNNSSPEVPGNADLMGTQIEKILSHGNVRITKGENTSYSDEAIYTAADKQVTLLGNPRLVMYATEGLNASAGN
jgi:LPS export ABC transporter protein LptC